MELLIATGNPGKVREFQDMLSGGSITWRSLADFPEVDPVEETGTTFRANAILKASGYARATGLWSLADDSGLEVDALAGKPGVFSARWAQMHGETAGDASNNVLLLKQLENVPEGKRSARFVCVLALADPAGRVMLTVRDTVEGVIQRAPVGEGGFGYDPLFYVASLGQTTAELSAARKHEISHRGKALGRLKSLLEESGLSERFSRM